MFRKRAKFKQEERHWRKRFSVTKEGGLSRREKFFLGKNALDHHGFLILAEDAA
jgi:hypothetical protein